MGHPRRIIDDKLDHLLSHVPAIAIDGPNAGGTTTTAERHARGLLMLSSRASRTSIQADPKLVRTTVEDGLHGYWPRRNSNEHQLIYQVVDGETRVAAEEAEFVASAS